jgi:hypothetical protein
VNLPVTFRVYKGKTQPDVRALEVVFWQDDANNTIKILVRLEDTTEVFEPV